MLTALSSSEPGLYHALTSVLNEEQQKELNAVFVLADQRKAQQDSKRIEQSGGTYSTLNNMLPNANNLVKEQFLLNGEVDGRILNSKLHTFKYFIDKGVTLQ